MPLQGGGVPLQVAQELLPSQVQIFTEHVNVQVIPGIKKGVSADWMKRMPYSENEQFVFYEYLKVTMGSIFL